jgi:hypothetical protein
MYRHVQRALAGKCLSDLLFAVVHCGQLLCSSSLFTPLLTRRAKFAEIFADQGAPPVANGKKSSILKVLIILFGHLWEVDLTYKYNLRSQQPDIVPIICHQYQQH